MRRNLSSGGLWLLTGLLLLLPIAGFVAHARAASGELNLTASPLPITLSTLPGTTVTTKLEIRNSGSETESLKINLLKFGPSPVDGEPQLMERQPGDDYFDWVKFSEPSFSLAPNVQKTITMTVKVPSSAALGYYYAVVFSRANPNNPDDGKTGLNGGLATLVVLEAKVANAKRELSVAEFKSAKRLYEYLPANFEIKFANTGNIYVPPFGNIFIKKGSKVIETIDINSGRRNVLPRSNRIYTAAWDKGFPVFQLQADKHSKLNWDFTHLQNFRFGKYTANLVAAYDNGKQDVPLEATVSFWVIPWKLGSLFLLIFGLIGFVIVSWIRKLAGFAKKRTTKHKTPES